MMRPCNFRRMAAWIAALGPLGGAAPALASDHLDAPTAIADPSADIADLYAWIDPTGERLNLAMTLVGQDFSPRVTYAFHLTSGPRFGTAERVNKLECRFSDGEAFVCKLARGPKVSGRIRDEDGATDVRGKLRIFAGLRDDPFFNNVKGTRAAYEVATTSLAQGTPRDAAGCPAFDQSTAQRIRAEWRSTDGGPAQNFLQGWSSSAIVASIDLAEARRGGPLLSVWASTSGGKRQIDRAGRPLTGNSLLVTIGDAGLRNEKKERYNRSRPSQGDTFIPEIAKGLAVYDGFDGRCGNGWLGDHDGPPSARYRRLARLLADDRLWIDSRWSSCRSLFAVELAWIDRESGAGNDCGGRAPDYDAANIFRSLLVAGKLSAIDDGLHMDDAPGSRSEFPFLAPPR